MQENHDEYYKQIFYTNEYLNSKKDFIIKINLTNQFYLSIFIFLILTSQSNALPILQVNYNQVISSPFIQQHSPSFSHNKVHITNPSTPSIHTYKIYRHFSISNHSNNIPLHVNDHNQQQFKRERYRRTMIDRLILLFDEDANGQLSKDELYSLSLRLNIFPKFHHFLKQTSSTK